MYYRVTYCPARREGKGARAVPLLSFDKQTNEKSPCFCCFIVNEKACEVWKVGVRKFLDCARKKTWQTPDQFVVSTTIIMLA